MPFRTADIELLKIAGYSEVADIVAGRPLHHFGNVVSFYYRQQEAGESSSTSPTIDLVVQERTPPHRKIGFRFQGVRDVQFSGWAGIGGLYIQSIKDSGWEDIRFEAGDYEESGIHLYCREISVFDPDRIG